MRKTTVLIVEAQPVLSQGVAIALGETADLFVVGACDSVAAARDLAASIHPDVMVIDLQVDDGSLSATLPTLDCAVVLLGGDAQSASEASRMRPVLPNPVLPKECSLEDLVTAIRHASTEERTPSARESPPSAPSATPPPSIGPLSAPRSSGLHALTRREIEILELLVQGRTHRAIAEELNLAVNTVRTHTHNIHLKLNVHSDLGAVAFVLGEGERASRRPSTETSPSSSAAPERKP